MELKVGDEIEILEDGGMIRKGDKWIVLEIAENGKYFYYCGTLALSVNSKKYKKVNMEDKWNEQNPVIGWKDPTKLVLLKKKSQ